MKPVTLLILIAILAVMAGSWWFIENQRKTALTTESSEVGNTVLGDQFDAQAVGKISITGTNGSAILTKVDESWVVENRGNYRADIDKIRSLVRELTGMKIMQVRETGEKALDSYGLQEPGAESGQDSDKFCTKVELLAADGKSLASLRVGKNKSSVGSVSGRYLLDEENMKEALVVNSGLVSVRDQGREWLDNTFFEVKDPKSISVQHADSATSFAIERTENGGDWTLLDPKEGEQLSTTKLDSVVRMFDRPSFYDVLVGEDARPEVTGLDQPSVVTVSTFDGLEFTVSIGGAELAGGRRALTVKVSGEIPETPGVEQGENGASDGDVDNGVAESADDTKKAADNGEAEAKREREALVKERFEKAKMCDGWIYAIPSYVIDSALTTREEILMTDEEKSPNEEAGPGGLSGGAAAVTPPISIEDALKQASELPTESADVEDGQAGDVQDSVENEPTEVPEASAEEADASVSEEDSNL